MKWWKKALFALLPAILLFGGAELVLRATGFAYTPRQRVLWKPTVAEFDSTLENYFPTVFDPPGYIWIRQDRIAGMGPDRSPVYTWPKSKRPGVVRVAFLGGSTSEPGGDHPYPERCIELLNAVTGPGTFEELNVACASYSTHQSRIALERYVKPRNPDVVVVYHGWNDSSVMDDAFADKEKDSLMPRRGENESEPRRMSFLAKLAVTALVGKWVDAADRSWPRPRVDPEDFRANMKAIGSLCQEWKVPLVIVTRPRSMFPPEDPYPERFLKIYGGEGRNDNPSVYQEMYNRYVPIQRELAARLPGARLADADTRLWQAQQELAQTSVPLRLFVRDGCHNIGLGYQKLAEAVALAVAPDLASRIAAHIERGDYWAGLAADSLARLSPYEAAYCAQRAKALDPSLAAPMDALLAEAENTYAFYEMFEKGKWGGELLGDRWQEKLDLLRRCQQLRPSDYGICLQIFRVCIYTENLSRAAEAMNLFQPADAQGRFNWLQLTFQSHLAGQRWNEAVRLAQEILQMAPNDATASGFLREVERQTGQPVMPRAPL